MSRGLEGNWAQPQDTWVIQQESGSSMVRSGDYPPIGRLFGLGGPPKTRNPGGSWENGPDTEGKGSLMDTSRDQVRIQPASLRGS